MRTGKDRHGAPAAGPRAQAFPEQTRGSQVEKHLCGHGRTIDALKGRKEDHLPRTAMESLHLIVPSFFGGDAVRKIIERGYRYFKAEKFRA